MERVENIELSTPQLLTKKIGILSYRGYKCANCSQNSTQRNEYLIIAYESRLSRHRNCPHCQELTITRTKETIKTATRSSQGKRVITDICNCCDYAQETEEIIPRLSSPSNTSYTSGGCSSGGYTGGSSGGGGSFGGGGSDGGGAGGSW